MCDQNPRSNAKITVAINSLVQVCEPTRFECDIDERGDEIGWLASLARAPVLQGADVHEGGQRSAHLAQRCEAALRCACV